MKTKYKAFVSRSLNFQDWPMWATIIPGQETKWYDTEHEAKIKVQEWNQDNQQTNQVKG